MRIRKSQLFLLVYLILFTSVAYPQEAITLKSKISSDLARKLSGVRFAIFNSTPEQVSAVVNNTQAQDLLSKVNGYLKNALHIQSVGFTETQMTECMQLARSICDIVSFSFDPGVYKASFGAIGSYKNASLSFTFCDKSTYIVQLENVPIDGMAYAPNRFLATLKRIDVPKYSYDTLNRLSLPKLQIVASNLELDSLTRSNSNKFSGIYRGLGFNKNTASYTLGFIEKEGKPYLVYMGGGRSDWTLGEVKAELVKTANKQIFLAKWYDALKQPTNISIVFNDSTAFTVKSTDFQDDYVKIE